MKQTKSYKKIVAFIAVLAMILSVLPARNVMAEGSAFEKDNVSTGSKTFNGDILIIKQSSQDKCGVAVWTPYKLDENSKIISFIKENNNDGSIKGLSDDQFHFFTETKIYFNQNGLDDSGIKWSANPIYDDASKAIYCITGSNGEYTFKVEKGSVSHIDYGTYRKNEPTVAPTQAPTQEPTQTPTQAPIATVESSNPPFVPIIPSLDPTEDPTVEPTEEPMVEISEEPTKEANFDVEDPDEEVVDVEEPTDHKLGTVVTEEPKTAEAVNDETPKTGDFNNTVQYVIMLLGSVFGLVLLYRRNRKIIG